MEMRNSCEEGLVVSVTLCRRPCTLRPHRVHLMNQPLLSASRRDHFISLQEEKEPSVWVSCWNCYRPHSFGTASLLDTGGDGEFT